MFDHQCTACGKRRLVFPSQVTSVTNSDAGITVSYACWCGADQTWVTGRRRADQPVRSAAPSAA